MNEPYKVPFTYTAPVTRQIATAPDGTALLVVSCDGPALLLEDGVHVGDFLTMREAREAARRRYEARAHGQIQQILWVTVLCAGFSYAPGAPPFADGDWVTVAAHTVLLWYRQVYWNEAYRWWDFQQAGQIVVGFLIGAEGIDWVRGRVGASSTEGRALLAAFALAQGS